MGKMQTAYASKCMNIHCLFIVSMLLHPRSRPFTTLRVLRCWKPRILNCIATKHLLVTAKLNKVYGIKAKFKQIGTKFLLITAPQQNNVDSYMKKIYDTYSDFVMKNPFHTPEMPIRSDQFDQSLLKFINTNGTA